MNRTRKTTKRRGGRTAGAGLSLITGQSATTRRSGVSRTGGGRLGRAMSEARERPRKRRPAPSGARSSGGAAGGRMPDAGAPKARARTNSGRAVKGAPPAAPLPVAASPRGRAQAKGRIKLAQIKGAGIKSRRLGHISGSVKRTQARRDSKNG